MLMAKSFAWCSCRWHKSEHEIFISLCLLMNFFNRKYNKKSRLSWLQTNYDYWHLSRHRHHQVYPFSFFPIHHYQLLFTDSYFHSVHLPVAVCALHSYLHESSVKHPCCFALVVWGMYFAFTCPFML